MDTRTPAVVALPGLPLDDPGAFAEQEVEVGPPGPHDLLVDVRAVSVNPVDVKVRARLRKPRVLGFDAAGVVVEVGEQVTAYAPGDEVYYAGSIARSGSNAARQLVDERIVGRKPRTLDFAEAAALPLTAITAWEALFDHLRATPDSAGTLLVVGGAGGVGSVLVQLARALTGMTVVATASRPVSADWVRGLGAHHVADHHDLVASVRAVAPGGVDHVFTAFSSSANVEAFAELLRVRGEVVAIDDPQGLDLLPLKARSQSWHWEAMFARPLHEPESTVQRELLDEVARLVDEGVLRTTMTTRLEGLTPATLREAHQQVASSTTVGKVVLTSA